MKAGGKALENLSVTSTLGVQDFDGRPPARPGPGRHSFASNLYKLHEEAFYYKLYPINMFQCAIHI